MSKGKELVKNTAIIAVGRIATQFISFLLLPLYTAVLAPEEFGTVDLLITIVALALPIVTIQIEQGVFRYLVEIRDNFDEKKVLLSTTTVFVSIQICITLAILLLTNFIIPQELMLYIILNTISNVLSIVSLQVARGLGKMIAYSFASFLTAALIILFNVYFLMLLELGVRGMLLAIFIGNMACFGFLFLHLSLWKYIKFKIFNKSLLLKMLKYSAPLVPHALSWWIVNASDRVVVTIVLGVSANGLIAVAHKFPSVYAQVFNIFSLSWAESGVKYLKSRENKKFFVDATQTAFNIFLAGYLMIVSFLPLVYRVLVDEQYIESYNLVPIYMLSAFFSVIIGLYNVIYTTYMDTKEIAKTTLMAGIINVIINVFTIRIIGVYAAPISSAVAYGVMSIFRYYHSRKYVVIKLSVPIILTGGVMIVGTTAVYMINNIVMCAGSFLIAGVYSVYINKKFIMDTFITIRDSLRKKLVREN